MPQQVQPRQLFFYSLWLVLVVKLLLAGVLPVTSDEAYFFLWGANPALGHYDHPPMVGWWLALLLPLGDALWWLRMPAVLISPLIGFGIVWILRDRDEDIAWLTGALFMISPLSVLNVLITTDTPLIAFAFLSIAAFYKAVRSQHYGWYVAAGIFLGSALLSKYFAGLLAIAMGSYLLFAQRKPQVLLGLLIVALTSAALFSINIYWNYAHCWDNFMFNFLNRNQGAVPWYTPVVYLVTLFYVLTPPVSWYLLKRRQNPDRWQPDETLFLTLTIVPFGLLGLLSFGKIIGIHWLLGFQASAFILLALRSRNTTAIRFSWRFNSWFTLAHVVILLAVVLTPWQKLPLPMEKQKAITDAIHGDWVWTELAPHSRNRQVFTHSYAGAAQMSYYAKQHVGVFGEGSHYAREDDKLTNYAELDGQDFLVFLSRTKSLEEYAPYFDQVEIKTVNVRGSSFDIVLGNGFRYPVYRDKVLKRINERFYNIPEKWPLSGCYFKERYQFP
jgi:hypothetical protein